MGIMYPITVKSSQTEWGRGVCTVLSCCSLSYMHVLYMYGLEWMYVLMHFVGRRCWAVSRGHCSLSYWLQLSQHRYQLLVCSCHAVRRA